MKALALPQERRAHDRVVVGPQDEALWLVPDGGKRQLGYIADRGEGGARVELIGESRDLQPGQEVGLAYTSGGGAADPAACDSTSLPRGRVVWMSGVYLGLEFLFGKD